MQDLDKLWLKRLRVLLENVASDEEQYLEIARTAEHIQADYHGRFLVELIQNAADQATSAGLTEARLLIVHRNGLLAVANAGASFSDKGINALTSLGLSPKKPDEAIGNKGVGFKAVFEVTSAPELYGAARAKSDLSRDIPGIRFKICADPFSAHGALERAESLIAEILETEGSIRARLADRFGEVPKPAAMLPFVQAAPPFKFPLLLDDETWAGRLDQLRLRPADLEGLESLVLLPVKAEKTADVDKALSELASDTGAIALFLPGVAHIDVMDGEKRVEIRRVERGRERLGDGWFSKRETSVKTAKGREKRAWWFSERMVGDAPGEADRVRAAVAGLPGAGWSEVERVPIAVALPMPDPATLEMPLDGKYVIGLPTLDTTGLAWWVNGHFHGTISRKAIDLDKNELNKLILGACARLMRATVERLKQEPFTPAAPPLEHFAVALSLKGKALHLWKALTAELNPFAAELVLAPTGDRFVAPNDLCIPEPDDRGFVLLASPDLRDARLPMAGFQMPHPRLLAAEGKEFLDIKLKFAPASAFLEPLFDGGSLIEQWAIEHRAAGPNFWRPFLEWAVRRVPAALQEQAVVPVAGGGLARPDAGIFLPLDDGDVHAPPASDLDGLAADALLFADSRALFDHADPAGAASLRKALATASPAVADEPHYLPLLEDALLPTLVAATEAKEAAGADRLFALALRWVSKLAVTSDARVRALSWPVPTASGSWRPAARCYTGEGWARGGERAAEAVIGAVYGAESSLPEWRAFRARFGLRDHDRESARSAVARMGVASKPRILKLMAPAAAYTVGYQGPSATLANCPWPGTEAAWARWLAWVREYGGFNWRRNTTWKVTDATWIDGLELPGAAEILGEWILRHPDGYSEASKATFRADGYPGVEKPIAPWVHFLRSQNPRIVPTTSGSAGRGLPVKVLEACVVPLDLRRRAGMGLLPIVADGVNEQLRTDLAVVAFPTPPAWWVIRTLKSLAAAPLPRDMRGLEALVQRLWGRLNAALGQNPTQALQDELFTGPVLVWRGKSVVPIALTDAPTIYIDDDPFNTRYITGFDKEIVLRPSRAETAWSNLTAVLARKLGAERVRRTGEIEPNVAFESEEPDASLIEWLERKTRLGGRLRVDLAAVLCHGGRTSLSDGRAKAAFKRLLSARVQFGLLTAEVDVPSHWRRSAGLLAVSRDIEVQADRVFAESWPVVGEDWREAWSAFAHALAGGKEGVERFFWERRIGEDTRDEVRIEFGLDADRLRWLQPTLFALWASRQEEPKKTEFERQLAEHRAEDWAEWLATDALRALVTAEDGEHRPEDYVPLCRVSWPDWQHARRVLGMGDYRFPLVKETFHRGLEHLSGCILGLAAAGLADPALATRVRQGAVPQGLVLEPLDFTLMWEAWLGALNAADVPAATVTLLDPVAGGGAGVSNLVPAGCDAEIVGEYRDNEQAQRERRSGAVRAAVERALAALNLHRGTEAVDPGLWDESSLAAALRGPLANQALLRERVALMLAGVAPGAHAALSNAGLFARGKYAFDFGLFADGLAPRTRPPTPSPPLAPPPRARVAGVPLAITSTTAPMGAEQTAQLISAMSDTLLPAAEMAAFLSASAQRQAASPRAVSVGGSGGGGGGGRATWRPPEESEDAKRATGVGGELFVLQQFKQFPGFDEDCWKSTSRAAAGLPDDGNDGLGYDFAYNDATGCVGQRPGVRCLIEVKSSQGAADPTFPMSKNEWRVAGAAHVSEGDVYLIVRVENVATAPRIADVLIDPFRMCGRGEIELAEKDLWVSVSAKRAKVSGEST